MNIDNYIRHWAYLIESEDKMFDNFNTREMLSEGKHWPEDYEKPAYNAIKQSELGKQAWCSDELIRMFTNAFITEFKPLLRKNSNLKYFMPLIRMFIGYSGTSANKCKEFLLKINSVIGMLLHFVYDKELEQKYGEKVRNGMSYSEFENLMNPILKQRQEQADNTEFKTEDKGFDIIKIDNYEQMNNLFGGDVTGYNKEHVWCHTNGKGTYNTYTQNGKHTFFVVYNKDWKKIEPKNPKTTNAYDDYGTSLMALLVDGDTGDLSKCTLRWNHEIEPSETIPGRTVDNAFISYPEISKIVGFDVEKRIMDEMGEEIQNKRKEKLEKLKNLYKLETLTENDISKDITEAVFPKCKKIGDEAFCNCSNLTTASFPACTSIGKDTFYYCYNLTTANFPACMSIRECAFYGCKNLTSASFPACTSIGYGAFCNCYNLTSINFHACKSIGVYAFCNCYNLTTASFPACMSIGEGVFINCIELTTASFPECTSIGYKAFCDCSKLTTASFPDCMSIEKSAFYNCKKLSEITLKEGCEIGYDAIPSGCKVIYV